jgi:hypothetical protein
VGVGMGEEDLINKIAYKVVIKKIIDYAIIESISGDIYISHAELKNVLGCSLHIPKKEQCKIIKELYDNNILFLSKTPTDLNRKQHNGEVFYSIKKSIITKVQE